MQLKQFRVSLTLILFLLSSVLLGYLLWVRLQLSFVRYFDADELAYLHWAHNVFSGVLPYRDFLLYAPPGFLYVLSPLFLFFKGTAVLIAGRVIAFCIFAAIAAVASLLFWRVRHSWMAVWVGIFLVFIPLPADKFLEVRPDNLAMLLALIGLLCQVEALRGNKRYSLWIWAGFWYGVSLLILPKTLPQIAVAGIVSLLWAFWEESGRKDRVQSVIRFIAGGVAPMVIFFVWILTLSGDSNILDTVMYSLGTLPFEVNRIGELFGMQVDLFFYPNATYYGAAGWASAVFTNHTVWFVGLMMASARLVTPFLPNGKKGAWAEILVAFSMVAHIVAFMYGYPLRHAQYLIPIAVFVAFYAADTLHIAWNMLSKFRSGVAIGIIGFILLTLGLLHIFDRVNSPKFFLTNREDMDILTRALATIPKDAYVLDLVGSTMYFRDPYYVCCVPFGQWAPYLSRPLPGLAGRLETTGTRYVYQGSLGRLTTLPESDQEYIRAHFSPSNGDPGLLIRTK